MRTQHLAAGLYSQLDQFYLMRAGHEPIPEQPPLPWGGLFTAPPGQPGQPGRSDLESPLPPPLPAGTEHGDYELAPAPPDEALQHFEMTNPVVTRHPPPPLSPQGYTPFPDPPQ